MKELFSIPPSPSPTLRWKIRHEVYTYKNPSHGRKEWPVYDEKKGRMIWPWEAQCGSSIAGGVTELEALQKLAVQLNLPYPSEL